MRESGSLKMMRIPQSDGSYKYFMTKKITDTDDPKLKAAESAMVMHKVGEEATTQDLGADPLDVIDKGLTWFEIISGVGGMIWSLML